MGPKRMLAAGISLVAHSRRLRLFARFSRYRLVIGQIQANCIIFVPQQAYEIGTRGDPIKITLIDDNDYGPSILQNLRLLERGVAVRSCSSNALSRKQHPEAACDGIQHGRILPWQ
jgi:hypothetical protein